MLVKTDRGEFTLSRKGTVAFSVVEVLRECWHLFKRRKPGELVAVHHRTTPRSVADVRGRCFGWCRWIATYDMSGKKLLERNEGLIK